jgi:hypothetical protein
MTMIDPRTENPVQFCTDLMAMAERELAAFTRAVNELFGSERVRQATEDWMEELALIDWPEGTAMPDWRQLTIAAAARLAGRINAQIPNKQFSQRRISAIEINRTMLAACGH